MTNLILGIDIGTASTKVIAFDLAGGEVASASRPYPLLTPQPGWVEQDAEQVWQALLDALREVAGRDEGQRIVSLALAAQAGSIIPTDAAGDPVHPMITWLDRRTDDLVAAWQRDGTAERIRQLSGWHPFPGLPLPVIAWLAPSGPTSTPGAALPGRGRLPDRPSHRPLRHRPLGRVRDPDGGRGHRRVERRAVRHRRRGPGHAGRAGVGRPAHRLRSRRK